jgi:hypothetical protein
MALDLNDEIKTLWVMIEALPEGMSLPLGAQLSKVIELFAKTQAKHKQKIIEQLQSLEVDVTYLDFDLQATKRERDDYRKRLNEDD